MTTSHSALLRRYIDEIWNQGRTELIGELLAENYVNHSPGSPDMSTDRTGVVYIVSTMRAAFPDLHYDIEDMVVGADAIAARLTVTGTHLGIFFGLPATGRRFQVSQINIEHVANGRIVSHHRLTDEASLMRQLTGPALPQELADV